MNLKSEINKIRLQLKKIKEQENIRDDMFRSLFEKIKGDHERTIAIVKTAKYEMIAEGLLEDYMDSNEEEVSGDTTC